MSHKRFVGHIMRFVAHNYRRHRQIDRPVYGLYGLTEDEVAVVEGAA